MKYEKENLNLKKKKANKNGRRVQLLKKIQRKIQKRKKV